MAAPFAEPAVLAAAKETLYPDLNTNSNQYAVTETQFTTATWGNREIPNDLRRRLEPYNTLRLASGEPDLLGVGLPAVGVLNANIATTPVAVIEAKGHNSNPSKADVHTGITQAHGHLSEVNLGYVAAPLGSITDRARALARSLNIGLIGVEDTYNGTLVEPARVTGVGDFSTTIDAIRFQATTHQLTDGSFPVNHPKNYLGYALALAADGDTHDIYSEYVINSVSGGRRGAILLGLVDNDPTGEVLTHLGAEVVRFAYDHYGTIGGALEEFASWKGRSTPFTELAPRWAQLARSVAIQYDPTQLIVEALERLHQRGIQPATIDDVLTEACRINQPLAVEVFVTQDRRDDVLAADGDINGSMLTDPTVYKSGIHFQFKFQLYHIGLLTAGGTDTKAEVLGDAWELVHPIAT
ncbi:hypothetical protein [Halalkalicoccus salilacus]|uniref:hypothetical protein n=1 Tax=Halalkalicoccus TaxID=332246 RepID=UPI002F960D95